MSLTIGQLVDWVIAHRRGKAFEGWSPIEIACQIQDSIEDNCMMVIHDTTGKINGLVCCDRYPNQKMIFVKAALTLQRGILKDFVSAFLRMYPDHTIEAERRGRHVVYNTPQLIAKLQY